MLDELNTLEHEARSDLAAAGTPDALEAWRIAYLGSKGRLRALMPLMGRVAKEEKAAVGKRLNEVKSALESAFAEAKDRLEAGASAVEADITLPGVQDSGGPGRRHVITVTREHLVEVAARLGFEVAEGPELEDDDHNFVKLNIPADHPARDPIDNFYVDDPATHERPRMMRSQTSTVQVRVMERVLAEGRTPPIRVVSPGRVYRPDTVDATHSFMFHQFEALYIDRGVSLADLKTTLFQWARAMFGDEAEVRLRPSFFPFTEPSAEMDMKISLRLGGEPRWIELGGCGMVDPAVLAACGIDPEEYTGFAWGFGIDRIAMGRYAIPDIRLLFEGDLRFLRQF